MKETKKIVGIAIGAALFGILMVHGGIPVFTNTKLTTAYIVPVIVGAFFGPIASAFVGFFGNILADTLAGWGYWFDWSLGNALACFFIGSLPLYGARIKDGIFKQKHIVIFTLVSVIGLFFSFGLVTPLLTYVLLKGELTITLAQAFVSVLTNSVVVLFAGIPILKLLAKRYAKQNNLKEED